MSMRLGVYALLLLAVPMMGLGEEPPYQPDRFFRTQILPILQRRCFECHSREHEVEGGLALDSKTAGRPAARPGRPSHRAI